MNSAIPVRVSHPAAFPFEAHYVEVRGHRIHFVTEGQGDPVLFIGGLLSKGMNLMINKLIPEHCPISKESLDYYRSSLPTYRSRKALGDFPRLLPMNGRPAASHEFALELQEGLARVGFPVLWIKADPGVVVSLVNPCGMRRLDELRGRIPRLQVREFGPGFHFLTEEDPDKVAVMVSTWLNEVATGTHRGAARAPGEACTAPGLAEGGPTQ